VRKLVGSFDASVGAESAFTAPSSWYRDPDFFAVEKNAVFGNNWLHVGRLDQLAAGEGAFFTGEILGQPFIVTKTEEVPEKKSGIMLFMLSRKEIFLDSVTYVFSNT